MPAWSARRAGVGRLVLRYAKLRLRLLEPRLGHVERGLTAVELGGADELLLVQVAKPLELVLGLGEVGARGGELGLGRLDIELVVARIEPRQQVAARHPRPDFDLRSTILPATRKLSAVS